MSKSGGLSLEADLDAALEETACLGAWALDTGSGLFVCARPLAAVLELDPPDAVLTTLDALLAGIDEAQRRRAAFVLSAATVGQFELELQSGAGKRGRRWLRLMGRSSGRRHQSPILQGLAFDVTDRRRARGTPDEQAQHRVNMLAEHAVAMKEIADELEDPSLTRLVDEMAIAIGYELARRLAGSSRDSWH